MWFMIPSAVVAVIGLLWLTIGRKKQDNLAYKVFNVILSLTAFLTSLYVFSIFVVDAELVSAKEDIFIWLVIIFAFLVQEIIGIADLRSYLKKSKKSEKLSINPQ